MNEPFQPNPGDTVEFYNEDAELWEPGTVFSYSADRRTYFIQPDAEYLPMWGADYTNIRPMSATDDTAPESPSADIPSFWEAAKTYARANRSLSAIVNRQEREIHSLQVRQSSVADERDMWMRQSIANSVNIGKLQAQIDAFPYETGAPVGDKVAARIAEYRERAEKAEGLLSEARVGWKTSDEAANAAEARIEELEDQNRQLKSELAELKAALRTLSGNEKPDHAPAWVKDGDFEVWTHTGGGRYQLEGSPHAFTTELSNVEALYGIRERSDR